ncbi:TetR/AcrR family transcriptional regulator [Kribbella lupini]|uniref:TetR/AcrR family transcriptional regulator n=1 Tax=Kribbella lupini TaxID=291602 RepID=A0ABN2C0L6_9ACTN
MTRGNVRSRIVDHAEDVFRRQGFSAASIQDLTDAADVPKGSFYNHFQTKAELAAEIIDRYVNATDVTMLGQQGLPVIDRLRNHFAGQAWRTMATGLEFGCLLATLAAESPAGGDYLRKAVEQSLAKWTSAVTAAISEGQAAGEVTTRRPAADLAAFLIDSFEGGALRTKVTGDATALVRHLEIALDALRP